MTAAPETPVVAGRWQVDASRSTARFAVRNFGVKTVEGTVPITEAYAVVGAGGAVTLVRARLDLAGLDTKNLRRDADLRKPRLLDTAAFPSLAFESEGARVDADGCRLPGSLTAHGRSTAVTLDVTRNGDHIHATCSVDRRDLGIRAPRLMIGHEVRIEIDAALTRDDG